MSCYSIWLKTTDHYQILYGSASWMRCSINSDREYEIHNLLDRMEDLRPDILNDKLYDSDTDHDMTLMKMKILFFPNYMHFLQESEVKLSLKCLQLFNK
jgi:hypothetical protein